MRACAWLAGALLLALAFPVGGDQEKGAKEPADLTWVPTKSASLVSVRPADLWKSELGKAILSKLAKEEKLLVSGIAQEFGLPPNEMERLTFVIPDLKSPPLVFVRSGKALQKEEVLKRLVPGGKEKESGDRTFVASKTKAAAVLGGREYVTGTPEAIENLLEKKPGKSEDGLAAALVLAGKGHVVVAGANPSAVAQPDDDLPNELESYRPLLKARYATAALDIGARWGAKLKVAFGSEDVAKEGEKAVALARKEGRPLLAGLVKKFSAEKSQTGKAMADLIALADEALKGATLKQAGKEVAAELGVKAEPAKLAVLGVQMGIRMREAASRNLSANKLKQIGLAMHGYHDKQETLPPQAVYDKDGKALLSWRVLLLPYLGEQKLYDEFKLDEPWDSKHNKKLLAKIPAVYRAPAEFHKKPGTTFYLAVAGKGAVFEGKKGVSLAEISDGTANTIMLVEGGKEVPWTKPEDLDFDADKELPKLGGLFTDGFNAVFCDGSVHFLSAANKSLKALLTRNGGEVVMLDQ